MWWARTIAPLGLKLTEVDPVIRARLRGCAFGPRTVGQEYVRALASRLPVGNQGPRGGSPHPVASPAEPDPKERYGRPPRFGVRPSSESARLKPELLISEAGRQILFIPTGHLPQSSELRPSAFAPLR